MSTAPYQGYVYYEFPKWKYHADGSRSRIVQTAADEDALGPWWFDTPSAADHAVAVALQEVALSISTEPEDASDILAGYKTPRKRQKKTAEKDEATA